MPFKPIRFGKECLATVGAVVFLSFFGPVWAQTTTRTDISLTVSHTGQGSVVSTPAGITCGSTCVANFAKGTSVVLIANPAAGHEFIGWKGSVDGICSNADTGEGSSTGTGNDAICIVRMVQDSEDDLPLVVTALFVPTAASMVTLNVTNRGDGTIISEPAGIDCGGICSASYNRHPEPQKVTLRAKPGKGEVFTGWVGYPCATPKGLTCDVTMDRNVSITATFGNTSSSDTVATLTVRNSGGGHVSSSPQGILCGTACSTKFEVGKTVTLTAMPAVGHRWVGWSMDACPTSNGPDYCIVTMTSDRSVSATFVPETCETRNFSATENRVLDAYISYYGRVASAGELSWWADRMDVQGGGNIQFIIQGFGVSDEYTRRFGNKTNDALVDNLYNQMYARHAEPAGLNWYVTELATGRKTLASIALAILDGTDGVDAPVLDNRRKVARHFAFKTAGRRSILTEGQMADILSKVTADYASANEACNALSDSIR